MLTEHNCQSCLFYEDKQLVTKEGIIQTLDRGGTFYSLKAGLGI